MIWIAIALLAVLNLYTLLKVSTIDAQRPNYDKAVTYLSESVKDLQTSLLSLARHVASGEQIKDNNI